MDSDHQAVYLPTDRPNVYESTPLANAGWYDEGQHGGAFAALIVGHLDSVPTLSEMEASRLTVELFRVVRLVPLRIEHDIVREGKKIQTITARVYDPDDTLVSMATLQRLRLAERPLPPEAEPPMPDFPQPDRNGSGVGAGWGVGERSKVTFHRQAMEVRESIGGFTVKGPGAVWLRLKKPIIAGRENTPLQRAVAAGDFVNGVSNALDFDKWVFMNPDLTIHLTRYPEGEWIGLSAESAYGHEGRGLATGRIWDEAGFVGRSTQSLFLDNVS